MQTDVGLLVSAMQNHDHPMNVNIGRKVRMRPELWTTSDGTIRRDNTFIISSVQVGVRGWFYRADIDTSNPNNADNDLYESVKSTGGIPLYPREIEFLD